MADPKVIDYIRRAATAAGADPVAMLATSLTENGARGGLTPGDNGSSFGYFQMHRGGALGNNTPEWATTYAVAQNRAREFARLQVHGGKGAAAVQRPADPSGYAAKVQANLAEARRLLGVTAAPSTPKAPVIPAAPAAPAAPAPMITSTRVLTNDTANIGDSMLQTLIDANARNAGIQSIQLPAMPTPTLPSQQPQPGQPQRQAKQPQAFGPSGRVTLLKNPKIIGVPYHGTHNLGNWESDNATDIAMPTGTPIYAPSAGVIGSQIGSLGASSGSRFAGLRVHLQTGGNELYYAHLSRLAVKAGQRVKAGQIIGYSGSANGVQHLHLGVRKGDPRRYA